MSVRHAMPAKPGAAHPAPPFPLRPPPRGAVGLACALAWGALLACDRSETQGPAAARPGEPSAAAAPRVVSLSLAGTRFLLALGARSQLVGASPESIEALELGDLPAVDLDAAPGLAPDLVLLGGGALGAAEGPPLRALREAGARVVEFAPHDFEDLLALFREVGPQVVGAAEASRFERAFSLPLAELAGSSYGQPRPRVVGLVGVEPLALAGGHSFETDLIETAGASSATHASEETRLALDPGGWARIAADLAVHFGPRALSEAERARVRALVPGEIPLLFFELDTARFWLESPAEDARRLRQAILALAPGAGAPGSPRADGGSQ